MSVRIKEGMIPYTGGIGIEVTDNHVINLLLREENNLIHVNEDNEVYVDLQLDDGILPDADFPVGVTTGKILQSDGWQDSGIILNWKTTSGDYTRFIYANDGKLYYDPGTGVWNEIGGGGGGSINVATATALGVIKLGSNTVQTEAPQNPTSVQGRTYAVQLNSNNQASVNVPWEEYSSLAEVQGGTDESLVTTGEKYRWNHKQDQLTAGNNITITNGVISANITNVYTYKGSVASQSDLPTSGQVVGDVWYALDTGISYAWNGSTWMSMGSFVDLTNYFNKTTDDSDDITEGSTHLFTTTAEKDYWNGKQDELTAGSGITINNNVISADGYTAGNGINIDQNNEIENTLPFDPDNAGVTGQILQKTSEGYEWKNFPNVVNSVNGQSGAVTVDEFEPSNTGTVGQVLKRTANGYGWYPESGGGGGGEYTAGHGINIDANDEISNTLPFEPSNSGTSGQVLKKTSNGYSWQNESGGGGTYTGGDGISIDSNNVIDNTGVLSVNNNTGAVTVNEVPSGGNEGQILQKTSSGYAWMNAITDANVKQWTINSNSVSSTTLKEIHDWVIADANNGAIIGDSYTNDVFLYHHTTTGSGQTNLIFYGVKRTSQKYTSPKGDYTEAWQLKMAITYNGSSYSCVTSRNTDDATVTNYLSVEGSGYTTPFIPTADYQPTSKKYVDDRAVPTSGTTGHVLTKTANGYGWSAPTTSGVTSVNGDTGAVTLKTINSNAINGTGNIAINEVPSGGTTDQILTKTSNGYGWGNAPVTSVNNQTGAVTLSIPSITSTTATLTTNGWSSSTQTVSVTGVTATNQVIVAPDPSDLDDYAEKGVYCSGQGSGTLTFTCDTTPTASITVNVLIMNL